jgi:hypothetical protein
MATDTADLLWIPTKIIKITFESESDIDKMWGWVEFSIYKEWQATKEAQDPNFVPMGDANYVTTPLRLYRPGNNTTNTPHKDQADAEEHVPLLYATAEWLNIKIYVEILDMDPSWPLCRVDDIYTFFNG